MKLGFPRIRLPQFGLRSVMIVFLIVGILSCWWVDRTELARRLALYEGQAAMPPAWGIEQVLGTPNTTRHGDIKTAWASATQDGQKEWLELTYPKSVKPAQVLINETYNPGAVYRVTGFDWQGRERLLWQGKDPKKPGSGAGISTIAPTFSLTTNRIRIYIDSPAVPGWNEIDAVGMKDKFGKTQWTKKAKASSTYGQPIAWPATIRSLRTTF